MWGGAHSGRVRALPSVAIPASATSVLVLWKLTEAAASATVLAAAGYSRYAAFSFPQLVASIEIAPQPSSRAPIKPQPPEPEGRHGDDADSV